MGSDGSVSLYLTVEYMDSLYNLLYYSSVAWAVAAA
jgi:hypothetical protein